MLKKSSQTLVSLILALVFFLGVSVICSASGKAEEPSGASSEQNRIRTVMDQEGITVTLPEQVERVVSVYPMATLIIYSLKGQDKLVGIDSNSPKNKVLQVLDRNIGNIPQVGMPWEVNIESVVATEPDVVIGGFGDVRESIEEVGLPVIGLNLESPEKLKEGIRLIGTCIGKLDEADRLTEYYDEKMSLITGKTENLPESERTRVLIPNKTGVRSCTGGDSYQNFLIEGAGGINVAESVTGRWPEASLEQIILWNPQVIIVPPYCAQTPEDILGDPSWRDIDAVKDGRVYLMPQYTVSWDTPVADSILGELWIAKKLYPELFSDLDIHEEIKNFYHRFYGLELTDAEIDTFLKE